MDFSKHSENQTSVKVHHAPGGQSNFSLGGDYGDDAGTGAAKPQQATAVPQHSAAGGQPPPKHQLQSSICFGNDVPEAQGNVSGAQTSVKVHHAPGGQSNFSLGGGYGEDKETAKPAAVAPPQQMQMAAAPQVA